jgi:hypothetical protein
MDAAEWAPELAYSLANGPGTLSLLTVATCSGPAASRKVIETAKRVVGEAGWTVYELVAREVDPDPSLLRENGFLILRDVRQPLSPSVPVLISEHQLHIRRNLPVGLLIVGSPAGIKALRRHPGLGFLSRAEWVVQD